MSLFFRVARWKIETTDLVRHVSPRKNTAYLHIQNQLKKKKDKSVEEEEWKQGSVILWFSFYTA